jgi:hypothetical protein
MSTTQLVEAEMDEDLFFKFHSERVRTSRFNAKNIFLGYYFNHVIFKPRQRTCYLWIEWIFTNNLRRYYQRKNKYFQTLANKDDNFYDKLKSIRPYVINQNNSCISIFDLSLRQQSFSQRCCCKIISFILIDKNFITNILNFLYW